jgi:hypothetical protein
LKTSGSKNGSRSRARQTWANVVSALDDDKTRCTVLARIRTLENKALGNDVETVPAASLDADGLDYVRGEPLATIEQFESQRLARERVCNALSYAEDWLEYEHKAKREQRAKLRRVRERLETELWP